MVRALTGSRWTHVGVVVLQPTGAFVFEAASPVKHTPLRDWIDRGRRGSAVDLPNFAFEGEGVAENF